MRNNHEIRLRNLENQAAQAAERQKLTTGIIVTFQIILSSIAAWLGINK